ncbi:ABC transporter substrate-binding protein [Adonisia turfae]|uniref:TIR domain-containing protein n=1 Tax=Adonisia turfae CCMR0081 TaxID=2292702 RepID=A0A6M0RZI6_9CYAN|nr:ABC transporter substrate-binding protein [Adonisia turfae]NEZ61061.1 TIR domain-containing protein [Adonisia turfae CCMR0081]
MSDKIELFISYSHRDQSLCNELETHLAILQKQGIINTWHDQNIGAGDEWSESIHENLKKADIILLLVSASFLASDYCYGVELTQAMERHKRKEVKVIPIILRPVNWTRAPFAKLQAFPKDALPVTKWENRQEAYKNIVEGIEKVINALHEQRRELAQQKEANKARYKLEVEELLLQVKKLGPAEMDTLNELQAELGLTDEEAQTIRNHVFEPIEELKKKISKYEKTLRNFIQEEYPFSKETRKSLKVRQQKLGIKAEDARDVELRLLQEFEIESIENQSDKDDPIRPEDDVEENPTFPIAEKIKNFWSNLSNNRKKIAYITLAISGVGLLAKIVNPTPDDGIKPLTIAKIESTFPEDLWSKIAYKPGEYIFLGNNESNRKTEKVIRDANLEINNGQCGGQNYQVAVPVPISGDDPGKAAAMLRGFAQVQREVNDTCNIHGKGLKLIIVDDADSEGIARAMSQGLRQLDQVLAVVGHWTSNVSLAASQIYDDQLVLITPISITKKLADYPYTFRMNPTSQSGAAALSEYLIDEGYTESFIIYDPINDYSQELQGAFVTEFESEGVGSVQSSVSFESLFRDNKLTPNGKDILQKISNEDKALVLFPSIQTIKHAIDLIKYIDQDSSLDIPIIGDMANLYTPEVLGIEASLDMVLAISWHFDDVGSDFACNARSFWKGDVNYATAMSYNALKAIVKAMQATNPPSRSSIQSKLSEGISVEGVSGSFSFNDAGVASTPVQLVQVQDVSNDQNREPRTDKNLDFVPINPSFPYKTCDI